MLFESKLFILQTMKDKPGRVILNLLLIAAISLFIKAGCSKENEDVQHVEESSLKATWRIQAFRYGQDSTNANAWHAVNYDKVTNIYDLYCIYDSGVNQSFLSKINCAYDVSTGTSIAVYSSDCARSVFRKDTAWFQQIKYDISLTPDNQFKWVEVYRNSKHINLINQPCSPLTYAPESDMTHEVSGKWSFKEASGIITVDYSPEYSRMDGQQVNYFRVTGYTGNTLSIKLVGTSGDEFKMQKL